MTTQINHVDHELIRAAAHVAAARCRGDNHTMAAAARNQDGRIITAVNAYHFTGGPCAELVLIGTAAAQGAYDLDTLVAVGDRDRGVVPPCGRGTPDAEMCCRRILTSSGGTGRVARERHLGRSTSGSWSPGGMR
ncbi:hypothetical protein GCM10009734_33310 [Nonomuraea bangladeshensis]